MNTIDKTCLFVSDKLTHILHVSLHTDELVQKTWLISGR